MLTSSSLLDFRTAHLDDAPRLAEVFANSWSTTYRSIIPPRELERTIKTHDAEWWRTHLRSGSPVLVFEVCGEVGGYATYGQSRGTQTQLGEVYELYLSPEYQGMGHGADLFEACRARLDQQWSNGLIIWVLSDNTPAIEFYERMGGDLVAAKNFRFAGVRLQKTLMTWDLAIR